MSAALEQRVKLFKTVRDIPYRIGLSWEEQDYCCATKTPLLQKLLSTLGIQSRRICCRFEWTDFGLPADILSQATTPEAGHEYLEVLVPENDQWIKVDPTWDNQVKSTGLPVSEWDGLTSTAIAVKPTKIFTAVESTEIINQIEKMPRDAWESFFQTNRPFLGSINRWLDTHRHLTGYHAQTH